MFFAVRNDIIFNDWYFDSTVFIRIVWNKVLRVQDLYYGIRLNIWKINKTYYDLKHINKSLIYLLIHTRIFFFKNTYTKYSYTPTQLNKHFPLENVIEFSKRHSITAIVIEINNTFSQKLIKNTFYVFN